MDSQLKELLSTHTRHIDAHWKALLKLAEMIFEMQKEIKDLNDFKKQFE